MTTPAPLRLAPGTEFLGAFRDSGLEDPPYLLRRADGDVVQVSRLIYAVATRLDGQAGAAQISREVSGELGRTVSPANVEYLVERRLVPLGLVAGDTLGAAATDGPPGRPALALGFKGALFPERLVQAAARRLAPPFHPVAVIAVLAALPLADVRIASSGAWATAVEQSATRPGVMLSLYALLLASMVFHELGHAAACHRGGARPGRIGIGIYLLWFVLYNDVTDSYRLDRRGRLRTDLGGIYFNALAAVASVVAWELTGFAPLLVLAVAQQITAALQLLPVVRFDGYYLLSDLAGVPDLYARMGPTLRSFLPRRWRPVSARGSGLRPRARVLVVTWVVVTTCTLAAATVASLAGAPAFVRASGRALGAELAALVAAGRDADLVLVALRAAGTAMLLVPLAGMALMTGLLARALWRRARRARPRRAVVAALALADLVAGLAAASARGGP